MDVFIAVILFVSVGTLPVSLSIVLEYRRIRP